MRAIYTIDRETGCMMVQSGDVSVACYALPSTIRHIDERRSENRLHLSGSGTLIDGAWAFEGEGALVKEEAL